MISQLWKYLSMIGLVTHLETQDYDWEQLGDESRELVSVVGDTEQVLDDDHGSVSGVPVSSLTHQTRHNLSHSHHHAAAPLIG